tara:strand:- start:240 stop:1316 length:1077 start_codon:yes stop_codon:yes gene_type:complete
MAYTTIDDPSAHFQVATWSGNGSNQAITNDGNSDLQPDLVWIKPRNESSDSALLDSTRGLTKRLHANTNDSETNDSSATMSSFDSDGFTMTEYNIANDSDDTGVAWQWKANGGSTSSNSDGDITSTVQANTTAGFSIVTFTGTGSNATVGHGLGAVPTMFVVKRRSANEGWTVYHRGIASSSAEDYHLLFNTNTARVDQADIFNDTAPTSSVFTVGTNSATNASSSTYVAYCWTDIKGYSKFGQYKGNNDNDGAMIYTGFKPACIWIKIANGHNESWHIWDHKRVSSGGNPNQAAIEIDTTGQDKGDSTPYNIDFLSTGFKIREDHDIINGDTDRYIYAAWAQIPFVTSNGTATTAGV